MEELLHPRHPLDKYHQSQLYFLAALPEAQRAEHARLFRLGNASYRYQQQAAGEVKEDDFDHWLAGLPEKMREAMARATALKQARTACRCGGTRSNAATLALVKILVQKSHLPIPKPSTASTIGFHSSSLLDRFRNHGSTTNKLTF